VPEYLTPGVYVEETSFRAKSIEGVSTSTTAFVGPTRKGPFIDLNVAEPERQETPELLTSFGDFERIYGGFEDLAWGSNYLAHAVRAYFDNGGSRLFVARVTSLGGGAGRAASAPLIATGDAAEQARFVARFPGEAGNGRVTVRLLSAAATVRSMNSAVAGTLVRVGGGTAARPARLEGGTPPFFTAEDGVLLLTVNGTDESVSFSGRSAEVLSDDPLDADVNLGEAATPANRFFNVVINGVAQAIPLPTRDPAAPIPRAEIVDAINQQLVGGYARLSGGGDGGPVNRLVIGTERKGRAASLTVQPHAPLKFAAAKSKANVADADNTVNDLAKLTADDINARLIDLDIDARAALDPASGRLVVTTIGTGTDATIAARTGNGSLHGALGLTPGTTATGTAGGAVSYFLKSETGWAGPGGPLNLGALLPTEAPPGGAEFLSMTITTMDADGHEMVYDEVGFADSHPRGVRHVLGTTPSRRADALENMFALDAGTNVDPFELRDGLFATGPERTITLTGGSDGGRPPLTAWEKALNVLERMDDVSIVSAPGHSSYAGADQTLFLGIQQALISHAERTRAYRIAVLDTPPDQTVSGAQAVRSRVDSKYAALYYPWVVVANPLARPGADNVAREIALPPSGFVCGIYARNDVERGVHKAPANEIVRGAIRFETEINFAQQGVLNPNGVNCLRFFPGRGYRVWGGRTISSDPEWKYVNVRRYFNYLERSIDRGTQWAVFESNGERLWANIRETVSSFLYNEWFNGALLGATPKEAFFVRCDRSTMTQNDLDNGRLVCLIGVAVLKPAEFVIFRIGQKTADARS
jgi:phage tail sheath protein FI